MPKPTSALESQANWIAAAGEPTRLALIRALAAGEKTVTMLARECQTEMVNVSHHLSILKSAGMVTAQKDGRFMLYSLVGAAATGALLEMTHSSGAKVIVPLA
ncbi:family transcriptional regulator : Probable transcription regulator OS=Planctomyces maris DSM 8797 GN=PM8797T_22538 PE=4 SV=1: HTH_20 [Gemmata massiliana]|uniref:HTH arsR-type domain-containing protein n=1 Tax=Gemmata massiliana TaxID=1210884 RepID=A0A6P2D512_9BACT|nr:metalloregulator ArsR/SmtB family transcription factor [Gemmata massiliana]VTR94510.1 family transcriptional regulator : Probable transcription regulator OS=Planctomyces maris DSM 8797 GN=PM8797T_22538 PE=4 SV=1: HTH_20 [Gemmata massiliana]